MRFALVGAGAIAALRKGAIEAAPGAQLGGVFDIDASKAVVLAGDAPVFATLAALTSSPAIDAVIVSTPPDTHAEIAVAAMNAGKHVLVEKPMANSLASCRTMLETSRELNRVLTVGFNHRYFPAVKALRHAVTSGEIGKLSYVRGFAGHTGLSEFKSAWMYSKDVMGGGALFDNGIHMIDLVHHIMGPVDKVYGKTVDDIWALDRVEDNGFALLSSESGVVGSLHASWSEWKGYHFYLEAYGSMGMARAYYAPMQSTIITMEKPGGRTKRKTNYYLPLIIEEKLRGWQSTAVRTLCEELVDFMNLCEGKPAGCIATAEDGFRSIEIAQAVYESNASDNAVSMMRDI